MNFSPFAAQRKCNFPGSPAHSTVTFTDETLENGAVASYSCERGFELLGPARRVCDNGSWTPEGIPFCGELFQHVSPLIKMQQRNFINHNLEIVFPIKEMKDFYDLIAANIEILFQNFHRILIVNSD